MSKVEFGPNDGAAFISNTFTEILAGMSQLSVDDLAARLLEKLIAEGYLELKPGCSQKQTAGMFAAAFKTIKLKMPAGI
jgi:hypothetical protein